jgi:hypothetical protein
VRALGGLATAAAPCSSSPTTRPSKCWGRATSGEVGRSRGSTGGSGVVRASKPPEGLELFPPKGAEEVRSSGLWLNAGGPGGRSARFAGLSAVIVNHERVI